MNQKKTTPDYIEITHCVYNIIICIRIYSINWIYSIFQKPHAAGFYIDCMRCHVLHMTGCKQSARNGNRKPPLKEAECCCSKLKALIVYAPIFYSKRAALSCHLILRLKQNVWRMQVWRDALRDNWKKHLGLFIPCLLVCCECVSVQVVGTDGGVWDGWKSPSWYHVNIQCVVGRPFATHDKAPCLSSQLGGHICSKVVMFAVPCYKMTLYMWIIIFCHSRTGHSKDSLKERSVLFCQYKWTFCAGWFLPKELVSPHFINSPCLNIIVHLLSSSTPVQRP